MKNKKIFLLFPLLILFTLAFSYFLSNNLKTEIKSEENMYYDITHNPSFPKVDGTVYDMALSEDGSILYVGGIFSEIGDLYGTGATYNRSNLAAINTSDYSVTSWAPITDGEVRSIQVNGDYVYIGGSFNYINEVDVGEFARVSSEGVLDESICVPNIQANYPPPSTVYDISITNDYIYVGGSFNEITDLNTPVYGLVRLNKSDCSWDSDWIPQPDDTVFDIEIYNGSIYIGGRFDKVNGTDTGEFAKLNADGTLNTDCAPNIHRLLITETVYDLSITEDYIYVGGSFNRIINDSNDVSGLVRLHNTDVCTWDDTWVPYVKGYSYTITPVQEDVLVGGSFDYIGGLGGTEFALLDGVTAEAVQYWNPRVRSEYYTFTVYSSIIAGNQIFVGGSFNSVEGDIHPDGFYGLTSFDYSYEAIPTIQINSIEDLNSVRENLMANYILTKDLDFENCNSYTDCDNMTTYTTGEGWEPIGFWEDEFQNYIAYVGTFDGQGHTISNLYINRPSESRVGLFGIVGESSKIQNVGLINSYVSGGGFTGGLVGILLGTVENSYIKGSVTGTGECIGGLVGIHFIEEDMPQICTIINSYSEASVSGYEAVGGLVGCNVGDVINSYSTGTVSAEYSVGGLIGGYNGGDILNSYWNTQTSGVEESTSGGIGLTTTEMKTLSSFSDWDIVAMNSFNPSDPSIWYISDGQDYPRLYWEYEAPEVLTKTATDITIESATLNGELISMDGETEVGVYFRYRQGDEGAWITVDGVTKTSSGVFSSPITGLTLNTQYQYQAVVTWRGVGTEYGNIVTFSTPETPPLPTVFGTVVSNIEDIQNPNNTEAPLVLTKIGTGSITFPSGLNLTDNYDQLSNLSENLVIVYEPSLNRFRAYVNSNGASFLASHGATIRFFNVRNQLGISGLTSSNFKTLLKVSVLNDSKSVVTDTSSYFDWNNASYNQDTDILTMPVNHFSEYVLGVNTGVLPSTGMSSLTMLIPLGLSLIGVGVILFSKKRYKKI